MDTSAHIPPQTDTTASTATTHAPGVEQTEHQQEEHLPEPTTAQLLKRITLLTLAIALVGTLLAHFDRQNISYRPFINSALGIKTVMPSGWPCRLDGNILSCSGTSNTVFKGTTISFKVIAANALKDMGTQIKEVLGKWEQTRQFELIKKTKTAAAGFPAVNLYGVYSPDGGKTRYLQNQVIINTGKYYYLVSYTATTNLYRKYRFILNKILRNLEFISSGNPQP